ncbi:hypothetical protein FYX76_22700 [Escherichia coli]|nr:hypothetical protein [Escherichia coli]
MMAGKIPAFFLPVPGQSTKEVAAGSALPGHAGMALWVFSYVATARCRGICEQRRKSHAVCETCHSER